VRVWFYQLPTAIRAATQMALKSARTETIGLISFEVTENLLCISGAFKMRLHCSVRNRQHLQGNGLSW
jgi:hypothetical protein